jgi:pectinesterase
VNNRSAERALTALAMVAAFALPSAGSEDARTRGEAGCVVAADGTGQFKSIQDAINAAPQTRAAASPWTIRIRPGTYHELIYVQREKNFVRLLGDDPSSTTITFNRYAAMLSADGGALGTFHTPTVWIDADDFSVSNLTIANSSIRMGQALALRVDGDRVSFRNCRFLGWQDTILANRGRHYFKACTICGAVDFIFGGATAFFDHCDIFCTGTGYITAASTPQGQAYGFVFSGCRIAGDAGAETYLGRPWRSYANVIFLNTEMTKVVRPIGWHNWNQPEREKTARFAEFGSSGEGANLSARAPWARALTSSEAKAISAQRVLGGPDGWNPESGPD